MKEHLLKFGSKLSKTEQKAIAGGCPEFGEFFCRFPWVNAFEQPCPPGYFPHPEIGVGICCLR